MPGEKHVVTHPDILILEGLNVLQTGPTLMVSDLFDFSVYVDARIEDIEQWYIERFLAMRAGAFADPASHFHHYAGLTDQQAVSAAHDIWRSINRPNLIENILPTRPRATRCCARTPTTRSTGCGCASSSWRAVPVSGFIRSTGNGNEASRLAVRVVIQVRCGGGPPSRSPPAVAGRRPGT